MGHFSVLLEQLLDPSHGKVKKGVFVDSGAILDHFKVC